MKSLLVLIIIAGLSGCYRMPNNVIYASSPKTVDDCISLGWRTADHISGCGILKKDYAPGKMEPVGEYTKVGITKQYSNGYQTFDRYFRTSDIEKGTVAPAGGVACPDAIDAYNIYEATTLSGVRSIMKNTNCRVLKEAFFNGPIVDRYKDVVIQYGVNDSYLKNAIVARYHNGQKWWSLD